MTRPNGHSDNGNTQVLQETDGTKILNSVPVPPLAALPEFATRAKQRTKQQVQQNRFVIIGAGAVVTALLIFVAMSMPHRGGAEKTKNRGAISKDESTVDTSTESNERCLFPITDSGRPAARESRKGFLNERDLQRTAIRSISNASQTEQTNGAETLGSIPPFGEQTWQAPPYNPGSSVETSNPGKAERDAMEKPSLMYVRKVSVSPAGSQMQRRNWDWAWLPARAYGPGWNRLQARLYGRQFYSAR